MFCSNCGKEVNGKFCSECGAAINAETPEVAIINRPTNPLLPSINGQLVDFDEIINTYGKDKIGAIKYLNNLTGVGLGRAKDIIDKAYAKATPVEEKKLGFWAKAMEQAEQQRLDNIAEKNEETERVKQMDKEGIAYCPKCKSTSLSAHKKGFGIGKAVVGATLTCGIGLIAGNIGAKKIRVTCLKCGHQFWAGK